MNKLRVKNDFIFQKIFGENEHKEILVSLLNSILQLPAEQRLTDLEIIENTKLPREYPDERLGIVDIRAKLFTGGQINIEIQLANKYESLILITLSLNHIIRFFTCEKPTNPITNLPMS